jgi:hypothetical protein
MSEPRLEGRDVPFPVEPCTIVVTSTVGTAGLVETAAAEAVVAGHPGVPVLVEIDPARERQATVFATAASKDFEARVRERCPGSRVVSRGSMCVVQVTRGEDPQHAEFDAGPQFADPAAVVSELRRTGAGRIAVAAPPSHYRRLIEGLEAVDRIVLLGAEDSELAGPLLELAAQEAAEVCDEVELRSKPPGRLEARRALAGSVAPARARPGALLRLRRAGLAGDAGQATPLVLGAVFVLTVGAVVAVAIAGAITGKGQVQRAADLAAMSAARSMKDDLPRLLAPPTLPNGLPNPQHMPKPVYLLRARATAVRVATANGASPLTVSVSFPDSLSFAPVRTRVRLRMGAAGAVEAVWAEARVGASLSLGSVPAMASGGGYGGPLAERQGEGMRPDVAAAFDLLAAAATADGVAVTITSGFRSDAEQAALFAANPDPRMVAPPGTSLHRCGTELDLGPPSAYGWLAANAGRFGFVKRYSWEPWHFGFVSGPAPCSAAGDRQRGSDRAAPADAMPGWVPARFRRPILGAAMKWGVSAALLAAQIRAESGFDPTAVSPAGASGIAQFMPATAASYGLTDPFDPERAIDAQAHLMSDLLKQFGSPALALAAYNAGPGAVASCNCVPDYPETQAYVARILATVGSAGLALPLPMEIELVG